MKIKLDKLKEQAPTLAVEAISVVFAVLLALAINEWRQGREQQQIALEAMARIRTEMRQNHANLAGVLEMQATDLDELQEMVNLNVRRVLDDMAEVGVGGDEQVAADLTRVQASARQLLDLEEQLVERYRGFLEQYGG